MYQATLSKTEYLVEITEDIINDAYRQAIKRDHTQPFTNFNQDDRDAYLRLKLRNISSQTPLHENY